MNNNNAAAPIPVGFRFHPTDEELVGYYLHGKVGRAQRDQLIQELDLYKIEPWDLHELCRIGDDAAENQSDWYFFSHKDKKYPTGNRANRATAAGFWKATGRDKPIHTQRHVIGMRKTLVFYLGRAPHGQKTDWIMHEFRLDSEGPGVSVPNHESDGWVVCRVFRKMKNFKTKSQEDTSCSFEEEQPQVLGPNHHGNHHGDHHGNHHGNHHGEHPVLSESPSFTAKHLTSAMSGTGAEYTPHFNFTCKQEISVDDYSTPVMDELQHTVTGQHTVAGLHPGPSSLIRSCLQQACRTKLLQDHHGFFSAVGPAFQGDSTSLKDFDDARSSSTVTLPSNEDWMQQRRDQTLADVTCHIHVKRQTPGSDRLFVSHENLVHLWNV